MRRAARPHTDSRRSSAVAAITEVCPTSPHRDSWRSSAVAAITEVVCPTPARRDSWPTGSSGSPGPESAPPRTHLRAQATAAASTAVPKASFARSSATRQSAAFLAAAYLERHLKKFKELGVQKVAHFEHVEESGLDPMRFTTIEKRIFKKALARHCETPCATSAPLAWLPLRSYGFRFIIEADWKVPSSREAIIASYPKNNIVVYAIKKHLATQTLACTALLRGLCVALCF